MEKRRFFLCIVFVAFTLNVILSFDIKKFGFTLLLETLEQHSFIQFRVISIV